MFSTDKKTSVQESDLILQNWNLWSSMVTKKSGILANVVNFVNYGLPIITSNVLQITVDF